MTAEIGLAALWMAAALCLLQFIAGALALRRQGAEMGLITRPAAIVQGLLAVTAFACLMWLFAITDLSVELVAANSHSDKPMLYKLTGTWGNHEGSMLLWVAVMALSGAAIAALETRLPERTMQAVLAAQGAVGTGFYAFLIGSSNPFARLDTPAAQGAGLNPLLQDAGLAFHPPTLYIGYVGLSVAFSFVVGALVTRQVTPDFARAMRPWVLGAWIFLTLGIAAGSWWAYYELGWGGWWFWDPVENASLMPWLAATALLHSVSVLAARDALRTWTVMLGVVAFSMSMLGTFLVRSGVLTSVHTFAVDPERGAFILVLLAIYIGGALALFAWRAGAISEGKKFAVASRESALVFNNIMLSAILGVVLLGTLYPLLAEALGDRVSIGPPYFNPVGAVFALPMFAVMAVGPLLRWRSDRAARISKPAIFMALAGAVVVVAGALTSDAGFLSLVGLAFAAVLAMASVMPLYGRRLRLVPLATWGMVLAHFGVAVMLFGMASESGFSRETLAAVRAGESADIGPYRVTLEGVEPVAGPNWTALEARLSASDGGMPVMLRPQSRTFLQPDQTTTESALLNRWNGQLYAVLGQAAGEGRWQLRFWWKPFVTLIWLGALLIALGGIVSAVGHVLRSRRQRHREEMATGESIA
ncbi:heme lyase CcmF/NrfE family subunit [Altererythrobacter sp. MTPC7]|uniref:heme lyase CcmF/NrfE family subunit n=1 Tax=Altererythrobacter sp. MTPC7 TaxID=3056567 RepID=UPI0036F1B535